MVRIRAATIGGKWRDIKRVRYLWESATKVDDDRGVERMRYTYNKNNALQRGPSHSPRRFDAGHCLHR